MSGINGQVRNKKLVKFLENRDTSVLPRVTMWFLTTRMDKHIHRMTSILWTFHEKEDREGSSAVFDNVSPTPQHDSVIL